MRRISQALVGFALMIPPALGAWAMRFDPLEASAQRILLVAVFVLTAARVVRPINLGPLVVLLLIPFALTTDFAALGRGPMVTLVATAAGMIFAGWSSSTRSLTAVCALSVMALMGLGQATERLDFALATGLQITCITVGLVTAHRIMPTLAGEGWRLHSRAILVPCLVTMIVGGAVMSALGHWLPLAEPYVTGWVGSMLDDRTAKTETGFSGGDSALGGLSEILKSDAVVMRLWPERPDVRPELLKGQVYQRYDEGRWVPAPSGQGLTAGADGELVFDEGVIAGTVRVERTDVAGEFYFSPERARRVSDVAEEAFASRLGVIRDPGGPLWGGGAPYTIAVGVPESRRPLLAPTAEDTRLPEFLAPAFEALSRDWAPGTPDPETLVALISGRLRGFKYTLKLKPTPKGADPLWHFLNETQSGHCELFASALVALVRARGVPARWVTGYRVTETNPDSGYAIVRERDAHAWAEVYYDGQWHTVDPTPPGATPFQSREISGGAATWDAFKGWLNRLWSRLGALPPPVIFSGLGVLVVGVFAWLALRRWARGRTQSASVETYGPFEALCRRLTAEGLQPWSPEEPILRYARQAQLAGHVRAAVLLERCAALRFGGEGDETQLIAAIEAYVAEGDPEGRG
ncbi:MAG: transglutaminase domain-containing protein [Bradymonadia bacterium]